MVEVAAQLFNILCLLLILSELELDINVSIRRGGKLRDCWKVCLIHPAIQKLGRRW